MDITRQISLAEQTLHQTLAADEQLLWSYSPPLKPMQMGPTSVLIMLFLALGVPFFMIMIRFDGQFSQLLSSAVIIATGFCMGIALIILLTVRAGRMRWRHLLNQFVFGVTNQRVMGFWVSKSAMVGYTFPLAAVQSVSTQAPMSAPTGRLSLSVDRSAVQLINMSSRGLDQTLTHWGPLPAPHAVVQLIEQARSRAGGW